MKILEILSGTAQNGAAGHCLLLSRQMVAMGHQVTVLARPQSWIHDQLTPDDNIQTSVSTLKRNVRELRRTSAFVKQQQFDVIHSHMSSAHFFGVLLRYLTGLPSVATAHQRHFQLHWMFNDRVIACAEATAEYQRRVNRVSPKRLHTIHNFVDVDRLRSVPNNARREIRTEFGIAEDALVIGTVGDVGARKGLIDLVTAFPIVLSSASNAVLLSVGRHVQDGAYQRQVVAQAERLGVAERIVWAGARSDVHKILHAMDVYCLPSLEESFPLSILEAMAVGLPVVATNVGGIPESVTDGKTGFLCPPQQPSSLGEKLTTLAANPTMRQAMGECGADDIDRKFSPQSQTDRTLEVLKLAINDRSRVHR